MPQYKSPKPLIFGKSSTGQYTALQYTGDLDSPLPIDLSDPDFFNTQLPNLEGGYEVVSTLAGGAKAVSQGGMDNTGLLGAYALIHNYLRRLVIDRYEVDMEYDLNSYVQDTDGTIYKSLVANNTNNALTDNTKWQNTGANIASYIAPPQTGVQVSDWTFTDLGGGNWWRKSPDGMIIQQGLVVNTNNVPAGGFVYINYHTAFTTHVGAPIVAIQTAIPDNGVVSPQVHIPGDGTAFTRFQLINKDPDSVLTVYRWTVMGW